MRWRPGRPLAWVAAGLALSALADAFFLYEAAAGLELTTTAPATLWPLGALLIGLGAWQPAAAAPRLRAGRFASLVTPGAAGALALARARLRPRRAARRGRGRARRRHARARARARHLRLRREPAAAARGRAPGGHRRADRARQPPRADGRPRRGARRGRARRGVGAAAVRPRQLQAATTTRFGHPAGDALLARLGAPARRRRSRAPRAPTGSAATSSARSSTATTTPRSDAAALATRGALASTAPASTSAPRTASCCSRRRPPSPPRRCRSPTAASTLDKGERQRASVTRQTGDVLLQALQEREPDLRGHVGVVGRARRGDRAPASGLGREERERIALAAQLHDVGKMAVPDAILAKPGPLDEGELELHPPAHRRRRADPAGRAGARARRAARALQPRALRRHRLPRPARRRGDPARRPRRGGLRRLPRDDQRRGPYSPARRRRGGAGRAAPLRGRAVRPGRRRGVLRRARAARAQRPRRSARPPSGARPRSPSPRGAARAAAARSRRRPRRSSSSAGTSMAASASMLSDTERS